MKNDDKTTMCNRGDAVAGMPWVLDGLVPAQLEPAPSRARLQPEARLALAVLEDAAETLRATCGVESLRARRLAIHAWSWIESEAADHPFTFRVICQHLDLEAAWLRKGLARWQPGLVPSARFGNATSRRARRAA